MFLIYRPVMDYEESLNPYLVCSSREVAEQVVKKVRKFMDKLAAKMPEYPPDEEDPDNSGYIAAEQKRREILDAAKWPYGLDLRWDLKGFATVEFDHGRIEIMELPHITKP
jgi:hypothetical protein